MKYWVFGIFLFAVAFFIFAVWMEHRQKKSNIASYNRRHNAQLDRIRKLKDAADDENL